MMLPACAHFDRNVSFSGPVVLSAKMPPFDSSLARQVGDPGVRVGENAKVELARTRRALSICQYRHRKSIKYYNDVRAALNRGPEDAD